MATAAELWCNGFSDIISVVPPDGILAPESRLDAADRGKVPGRRRRDGTWVGFGGWQKHQTTQTDADQWDADGANVGLRTEHFPAIDIDCADAALSQSIAQTAREVLGAAPSRVGRPPKQLLLYQTNQPFKRLRLWFGPPGDPRRHLVEALGAGQQFVMAGIHPGTRRPYEWDRDLEDLEPGTLTAITFENVEAFFVKLEADLEGRGFTCSREGTGGPRAERGSIDQSELRAPSIGALREAVAHIPNTNAAFPGRDDYIRMGYAIRAASQDDPDAGWDIFLEWALQWEGNGNWPGNDPETVRADWSRMKPPFELGWNYIADLARGQGYQDAHLYFTADQVDAPPPKRPEEDSPSPVEYSEQHLADIVVAHHGARIRHVVPEKRWYLWDGVRWQADPLRSVQALAKATLRVVADRLARSPERGALARARSLSTNAKVNNTLALVSCHPGIAATPEQFDADSWRLNTPQGIVNLRTAELRPNDPTALQSKVAAVGPDFDHQPARWLQFLDQATRGDVGLQRYLQRLAGYCLTGDTSEHVVPFIHGAGGNGKSVFLNALGHVLGDYATAAAMSTFLAGSFDRHPTEIAALRGARLVTASETDSRGSWNEARLKLLSGGDPVTARFMFGDFFTYQPQFKLLLVGNHRPKLSNVDDAIRRRLHLIPFTFKPALPDPNLLDKLRAEAPAILAWMIEGCLAWQKEGLAPPPSVTAATAEYFEDEDAVGRWMAERCDEVPAAFTTTAALFEDWREWCHQLGEDPGSDRAFSQLLKNRGFKKWREPKTRRMGFRGLALRSGMPDLADLTTSEGSASPEVG